MSKIPKKKSCSAQSETRADTSFRPGFMQGEFSVPEDFDQMGKDEIVRLFYAVDILTFSYRFNRVDTNKR